MATHRQRPQRRAPPLTPAPANRQVTAPRTPPLRELGLDAGWNRLRRQLATVLAAAPATPAATFTSYTDVAASIESLIAQDGNNSNMILDPDNDSYYLMDAVLNRVPVLIDTAGQTGDLQTVLAGEGRLTLARRIALDDLKGTIVTTLSNSDSDYASAVHNTSDAALKPSIASSLATADTAIGGVSRQLQGAMLGAVNAGRASALGATAVSSLIVLDRATLPGINHLLGVRIGGFDSASRQTELITLLGVLVAAYLFVAFFLSVRQSQTAILDGLDGLQESATDPLAAALQALAAGDLTTRLEADVPEVEQRTRDELGDVIAAVNRIRRRLTASIVSFNDTTAQLRAMIGDVSGAAGAVSNASDGVRLTSADAGRTTSEIAQAVVDVAEGAERQLEMINDARHAAERVVEGVNRSAQSAQVTAEAGQQTRRDAAGGIAAAEEASEAMRAVRESTTVVSDAITELAAKSGKIGVIVQTITQIADQTDLLALNAAIEAARAGEQGRGFAVVADEVRKLAEESQSAATEITALIAAIQRDTDRTVQVVRDGAQRTDEGARVVERTREAFERIGSSVEDIAGRIEEIADASDQISQSATEMQQLISDIAAVAEQSSASTEQVSASTHETSASTQQIAASAVQLAGTASHLEALVAQFRVSSDRPG